MSRENVELVRSALPRADADLIELFEDDSAGGELTQTMGRVLAPDFMAVKHFPGARVGGRRRPARRSRRWLRIER
jgi:hypothetical protein